MSTETEVAPTPGPWRQNVLLVQDAHGEQIAHCTRWERGTPKPEVAQANARLIAAAPDLLEAGTEAWEELAQSVHGSTETQAVLDRLRAALMKARGML